MKYKINTEQRYMSTYHFVAHNNLSDLANTIFGRGWEAEDDINQVQEICDKIQKGKYVVRHLNIPRIDEDIEVLETVSLAEKLENQDELIDAYHKWFVDECSGQYDELVWLLSIGLTHPTERENVIEALETTLKHMKDS